MTELIDVNKVSASDEISIKETNNKNVVIEIVGNEIIHSYADVEIKTDGEVLGKTRIMLFA